MKKSLLIITFAVGCVLRVSSQESAAGKPQGELVKVTGCVQKGVETGCLVLKDTKTQVLYDLKFDNKKADPGMAIAFDGVIHSGEVDSCQQGRIVHVSSWTRVRLHCPKSEGSKGNEKQQP